MVDFSRININRPEASEEPTPTHEATDEHEESSRPIEEELSPALRFKRLRELAEQEAAQAKETEESQETSDEESGTYDEADGIYYEADGIYDSFEDGYSEELDQDNVNAEEAESEYSAGYSSPNHDRWSSDDGVASTDEDATYEAPFTGFAEALQPESRELQDPRRFEDALQAAVDEELQASAQVNQLSEEDQDPAEEPDAEPFTGFDSQLEALLEDDEEALPEGLPSAANAEEASIASAPMTEEQLRRLFDKTAGVTSTPIEELAPKGDILTPAGGFGVDTSVEHSGRVDPNGSPLTEEARRRVKENTKKKRYFPHGVDEEFDQRGANLSDYMGEKSAKVQEKRERLNAKDEAQEHAEGEKSGFSRNPVAVVTKPAAGRSNAARAAAAEANKAAAAPKGKLKAKELEFFKELGVKRSDFARGYGALELGAGPLSKIETEEGKAVRRKRVEKIIASRRSYRAGAKFTLNPKMVSTLSFLALFRYATHRQISRMFSESERTTRDRLYAMQEAGFLESRKIYAQDAIWFLTEAGKAVSGFDLPKVKESTLTFSMFPHQFTVNHVAAHLWGGNINVLDLESFPQKNRTAALTSKLEFGEELTSELEILSTFSKMKLFDSSAAYRPRLQAQANELFKQWHELPNRAEVASPELVYGNEWLWALLPPVSVGIAHHVPDLVVKRPRSADGSPNSIAVEVEINTKAASSYERTLAAYEADRRLYKQVIWVCKTVGPAKKLEAAGRKLGLIQSGRLKIVPIYTSEGIFKGRDLWTI